MHNEKIEQKRNEITDALARNDRDTEHMRFSISEAEKELATLESDILSMQSQAGDVAAEAYLQGKPKLLTDHQGKVDKAEARRDALNLALGSLRLRLGVLGQVRGQLNRQETILSRFEGSVREIIEGAREFRTIRDEISAVPPGQPEKRRTILRFWEPTRWRWGRVPGMVTEIAPLAQELGLESAVRELLEGEDIRIHPDKLRVSDERSFWLQTGSRAKSA